MENKKISINISYLLFVCMALILMGGYQVMPTNQVKFFNIAGIFLVSLTDLMMLVSGVLVYTATQSARVTASQSPVDKKVNPNRAYFWLLIESAFVVGISFSPEASAYKWIVYLFIVKWVLMFVNNALRIKLLKKIKLP